jgi:hypothetical protein
VTVGSLDLAANKDVRQTVEVCEDRDKYSLLNRHLREHNNKGKVLIFVETKRGCDQLQRSLKMEGWNAAAIHGDKSQNVSQEGSSSSFISRACVLSRASVLMTLIIRRTATGPSASSARGR